MDGRDARAAGMLLAKARLHFKDQPMLTGAEAIAGFYAAAFHDPAPTRHLISNLLVRTEDQDIAYSATYQRWSLAAPTQCAKPSASTSDCSPEPPTAGLGANTGSSTPR